MKKYLQVLTICTVIIFSLGLISAQTFPVVVTDQTTTAPLTNPNPSSFQPRYISGFGGDNSFTVFFEDRDAGSVISYVQTTTGPTGFPGSVTPTNITDTHVCVKNWPIDIGGTTYAYRAWGAVGNNANHNFYVSNDMTNWTLVSTFTIPNAPGFTDAHGWVYYGFHDVILLNGTYYAFAESNQSQTMIIRSANGDDGWEAFAGVGGRPGWGPLELPADVASGWTPSGSFVDLGNDRGFGKIHVDPRDSHFYLAVNTTANTSLSPAALEAAFINPANWTWNDGTTGPAANPILSETAEHDIRECWVSPNSNPDGNWTIIYDSDFGSADGGKALGYATLSPPMPPPTEVWVEDDWTNQTDVNGFNPSLIWQYNAFNSLRDGINAVPSGTVSNMSIVNVFDGDYQTSGQTVGGYTTGVIIANIDYLVVQAVSGNEPVAKPLVGAALGIESSNHIIIDNIDLDGSLAGFDLMHVRNSNGITFKNSEIANGIDGIDVETSGTDFLIENNVLKNLSGDALDFSDGGYSDVTIQDNIFHNDNRRPLLIRNFGTAPLHNFIIRRNISYGTNDQEAFRIIGASDVLFENNVVMNSNQQALYIDTNISGGSPSNNITVQHNTFFNNDQELDDNGEMRINPDPIANNIVVKNNIIFGNGVNEAFETVSPGWSDEDYNLIYNTIDVASSFGINTIIGDPLFMNATAGSENLHLQTGSPAIGTGIDLGVIDDVEKNPRPQPVSSNPDRGAYESSRGANESPVPNAGPDQTVDGTTPTGADVTLDGSSSSDPNGDPLTYSWSEGGVEIATGVNPTVLLAVGTHLITLTLDDGLGGSATDEVSVTVAWTLFDDKSYTKTTLQGLLTNDKKADKELEKAIEHINKSLEPDLWVDEYHLDPKHGHKVFDEEKKAVNELEKIQKDKKAAQVLKDAVEPVIQTLVDVDYGLVMTALDEVNCTTDKCEKELEKVAQELAKAEEELIKGHRDHAIDKYKKAWEHVQHALKHNASASMLSDVTKEAAAVTDSAIPEEFMVLQNYPNPFNPTTTISYGLATNGKVTVQIYDVLGHLVNTLVNTEQSAGTHSIMWNGTNKIGELVPSGIYISRVMTNNKVKTMTMMYLK